MPSLLFRRLRRFRRLRVKRYGLSVMRQLTTYRSPLSAHNSLHPPSPVLGSSPRSRPQAAAHPIGDEDVSSPIPVESGERKEMSGKPSKRGRHQSHTSRERTAESVALRLLRILLQRGAQQSNILDVRAHGQERNNIYYFFQSIAFGRVRRTEKCRIRHLGKIVRVYYRGNLKFGIECSVAG